MKENHVLLFSRLSRSVLGELAAETEANKGAVVDGLKKAYENTLPGEVSFVQVDLQSVLLSGLPEEAVPARSKSSDQKLWGPKCLGRYGKVKSVEDVKPGQGSKQGASLKVTYASNIDASLCLLAALTLSLAGSKVAAMYPYKVVSKKGPIISHSSVVIPVSSHEEYNPRTQLALMIEVLFQNHSRVVDKIEGDLDDTSKPLTGELPSVIRILKENSLLHLYLKDYHAQVVDEFEELMAEIDGRHGFHPLARDQEGLPVDHKDEWDSHSDNHNNSASVSSTENFFDKDGQAIEIVQRNEKFLGIHRDKSQQFESEQLAQGSSKRKSRQNRQSQVLEWIEDSSDETTTIFDFDYVLLGDLTLLTPPLTPGPPPSPQQQSATASPTLQKQSGKLSAGQTAPVPTQTQQYPRPDYVYYAYRIERLPVTDQGRKRSSRDEQEAEISTRSEEVIEDLVEALERGQVQAAERLDKQQRGTGACNERGVSSTTASGKADQGTGERATESVETKLLSKAAKRKAKKLRKKEDGDSVDVAEELRMIESETTVLEDTLTETSKGKKKKAGVVHSSKFIEPAFIEEDCYEYEPLKERLKLKEMEKLKQDSKDYLKDQLLKVAEVEDLDEYERLCIVEINGQDNLTKKMKQKARRRLRQEIETEKAKRNEKAAQHNSEDFEDEYEEDNRRLLDFFLNNGKLLNLSEKELKRVCLENPTHFLMNLNTSGLNIRSLINRKFSSTLIKDPKAETKAKKQEFGGHKWKEKIQRTIEKFDFELNHYEEKIEQADLVYKLYQQFKDSSIKPVLNILHDDYHVTKENFNFTRANKETRIIFKLTEDTIVNENFFK